MPTKIDQILKNSIIRSNFWPFWAARRATTSTVSAYLKRKLCLAPTPKSGGFLKTPRYGGPISGPLTMEAPFDLQKWPKNPIFGLPGNLPKFGDLGRYQTQVQILDSDPSAQVLDLTRKSVPWISPPGPKWNWNQVHTWPQNQPPKALFGVFGGTPSKMGFTPHFWKGPHEGRLLGGLRTVFCRRQKTVSVLSRVAWQPPKKGSFRPLFGGFLENRLCRFFQKVKIFHFFRAREKVAKIADLVAISRARSWKSQKCDFCKNCIFVHFWTKVAPAFEA